MRVPRTETGQIFGAGTGQSAGAVDIINDQAAEALVEPEREGLRSRIATALLFGTPYWIGPPENFILRYHFALISIFSVCAKILPSRRRSV